MTMTTDLEFESRSRILHPRVRQSFALPDMNKTFPAILRETSARSSQCPVAVMPFEQRRVHGHRGASHRDARRIGPCRLRVAPSRGICIGSIGSVCAFSPVRTGLVRAYRLASHSVTAPTSGPVRRLVGRPKTTFLPPGGSDGPLPISPTGRLLLRAAFHCFRLRSYHALWPRFPAKFG
jgi:hypothetical protein